MSDLNIPGLTVRAQSLLNVQGRKYTIKADRVQAYLDLIAANESIQQIKLEAAGSALKGRVPAELNELIRAGVGYGDLKRNWDWPRGVLAVLIAKREAELAKS
jgi:hypothetical protein